MPIYIFICPRCGVTREILAPRFDYEPRCHDAACDGAIMVKLPTAAAFSVGGFNAKNGYSSQGGK